MCCCIKSSIGTQGEKKVREKSRECHNHKPQPFPDPKRKSCKSALNPTVVCSTDRSKSVAPVLVLLFVALWFIPRGGLLFVFPYVILFLCYQSF